MDYCVVCHNPGSGDPHSENTVDFTVMMHKLHSGNKLPSEISASNLDNYYRDFYEAGIYFNIECPHCEAEYTITPEDQEFDVRESTPFPDRD